MSSRQDQQLARLQREADRANQQQEQDGLATIAGTDSQGRTLIKQSGEIRPLDAYHSNAGGQLGQAIEVSGGMGAIAPRSAPRQEAVAPRASLSWWVVAREETLSEYKYYLGGHASPPVYLFAAPKTIPGCPSAVYVVASHERQGPGYQLVHLGPSPSYLLPPVPQSGMAAVLDYCEQHWYFNRRPGTFGAGTPGAGPFTVTLTPSTPGILPVDIDISDNYFQPTATIPLDTAQGTIQVAATVRFRFGNMTHYIDPYGAFYLSNGGYYLEYFGFHNRISVGTISVNTAQAPSSGVIQSYPLPNPDRGSGATIDFCLKGRIPFVKLSHSPSCGASGEPTSVLIRDYSGTASFPSFTNQPNQMVGTEELFYTGFPNLNLAQGASTPATISKWPRTEGWEPLPSTPLQTLHGNILNKWEWPPGAVTVAGGAVF